ncbi:class II aldolase/adducin N-terminal [Pelagophyceae sp. CCMP2097]|nr:class II aldolase/adducin N-terminal [Pelagophyceae sp. CCMP2097]
MATVAYSENQSNDPTGSYEVLGPYGLIQAPNGCNSDQLRQARLELAACYRIMHNLGMNEGVDNHLTVLVPGTKDRFLCVAYGISWSEVTASNLLLLNSNGDVLEGNGAPDPTAFFIHSRIHEKHPHATCVLHTHMPYATALTSLKDMELKMVTQTSLRFYDEVAYDTEYNGLVLGQEEGDRLAACMGSKRVLLQQNHGVITCGSTVAEAFDEMYFLERAARVQLLTYNTGREFVLVDDAVTLEFKRQTDLYRGVWAAKHFDAQRRCLYKPAALGDADFAS